MGFHSREGVTWAVLLGLTLLGARLLDPASSSDLPTPPHIAEAWEIDFDERARRAPRPAPPRIVFPASDGAE